MLTSYVTIVLAVVAVIPTSLAQNASLPAVCTATNLDELIFSTKEEKGHFCGFPFTTHLNFSSCCENSSPVVYKDPCIQYCHVNENQTFVFSECAQQIASTSNLTLGISGCWTSGAVRSRGGSWGGVVVGLGIAGIVLVVFI
ncbi:hypothetical protein BKA64DRAFT_672686 [Cadophora sp. MPI-SDFR-AT-0126]|nr:hypothetical protein BKA64DRAFT_672686 [Leotiomycetes sp. MPI-SDFR-AT-0126]